jgi:leader peptidase (prepilin peptidase)/N-methyltransferase|tara:strand:+ start:289 stop:636 length:348 start_codon:yes stop_codon:yes gene_type:complete
MENILLILQNFDIAIKYVQETYPVLIFVIYFALSATLGSFLGCCYYRLPKKMSLLNPKRSFCPNCKTELTTLDLVPLLSYLCLGAKCRHCKVKIKPTYFIIESLTVIVVLSIIYL